MDMTRHVEGTGDYHEILYEISDRVARITLNRPQAHNAYSTAALVDAPAAKET